jgi:hypothetical protein
MAKLKWVFFNHDIAEILLKVVLNTIDQNPIIILIGKYSVGCVPMVLGIDSVVYN